MSRSLNQIVFALTLILFLVDNPVASQGYGYVLFSHTGDTVLMRTSFGEIEKVDTITTCFALYKKQENGLGFITLFKVHEKRMPKHDVGFACADFGALPADTIRKYGLYHRAAMQIPTPQYACTTSMLSQRDTMWMDKKWIVQVYKHEFVKDEEIILTVVVDEINEASQEMKGCEIPKIKQVYYCRELNRYLIEYWEYEDYFDNESGRVMHRNARKSIVA